MVKIKKIFFYLIIFKKIEDSHFVGFIFLKMLTFQYFIFISIVIFIFFFSFKNIFRAQASWSTCLITLADCRLPPYFMVLNSSQFFSKVSPCSNDKYATWTLNTYVPPWSNLLLSVEPEPNLTLPASRGGPYGT
uniref:Uncharacterized protein n=1 Tax=Schizaphis graminum TaxID=13262 RepID=A0A2S2P8B8_SCHGA